MNVRNVLIMAALLCGLSALPAAEPARVVAPGGPAGPRQPQAGVDEAGAIYVAFGAEDAIYCVRSNDGGKSFGQPIRIAQVAQLALGMRRGPRIVAGQGALVVSTIGHADGTLLAWRSADGGQTWQGPAHVSDAPRAAHEGLHAMARGPKGEVYCVWLDLRNKAMQLYGSVSTDGGQTWSANQRIYQSPDGDICQCCHPAVAFNADGALRVMWRNALDGNRDLFTALSSDGGKTFGPATKLGRGSWELDSCPMDGGGLAAVGLGKWTTAWRREQNIFRMDDVAGPEQPLGPGEQPWVAGTPDGAYLVWLSRRHGDLWLVTPQSPKPRKLAMAANDPIIAAPATGKGPVVVAWESGTKGDTTIWAEVVAE